MRFPQRFLRRIRLRFGIRTLLVLVTFTAILAGTIAAWYRGVLEQQRVVAQLTELGASITYEADFMDRHGPNIVGGRPAITWRDRLDDWLLTKFGKDAAYKVQRVDLSGPNVEEALLLIPKLRSLEALDCRVAGTGAELSKTAWAALLRCDQLQSLTLRRAGHGGNRLTGLSKLSGLRKLVIHSGDLTSDDVREITELSQLTKLYFQLIWISDAALQPLAKLTSLQEFHLMHAGLSTTVTNEGVSFVVSMPKLRRLTLARMPLIDDQILQDIAGLKQLTYLNLDQAGVRGTELGRLKKLTRLTSLNLIGTSIDDQALRQLAQLRQLTNLDVGFTKITDAGTPQLAKLTQLVSLFLTGTKITDATTTPISSSRCRHLYRPFCTRSDKPVSYVL